MELPGARVVREMAGYGYFPAICECVFVLFGYFLSECTIKMRVHGLVECFLNAMQSNVITVHVSAILHHLQHLFSLAIVRTSLGHMASRTLRSSSR